MASYLASPDLTFSGQIFPGQSSLVTLPTLTQCTWGSSGVPPMSELQTRVCRQVRNRSPGPSMCQTWSRSLPTIPLSLSDECFLCVIREVVLTSASQLESSAACAGPSVPSQGDAKGCWVHSKLLSLEGLRHLLAGRSMGFVVLVKQWFLKCVPWVIYISITWELARKANS